MNVWNFCFLIGHMGLIWLVFCGCVKMVKKYDAEIKIYFYENHGLGFRFFAYMILVALVLSILPVSGYVEYVCWDVIAGALYFAIYTDWYEYAAYMFTWWLVGSMGIVLVVLRFDLVLSYHIDCMRFQLFFIMLPILIFVILQETIFVKTYGRADCYAFEVSVLVERALGMDLVWYLGHMILSYVLLIVIQACRGNISGIKHLKVPVAFLPYIVISFWIIIFLYLVKKSTI